MASPCAAQAWLPTCFPTPPPTRSANPLSWTCASVPLLPAPSALPPASSPCRQVRLAFSGSGLAKKDMMSQSDPFLRVLKLRQGTEDDWVPVCKTEVGADVESRQQAGAAPRRTRGAAQHSHSPGGRRSMCGAGGQACCSRADHSTAGPPRALRTLAAPSCCSARLRCSLHRASRLCDLDFPLTTFTDFEQQMRATLAVLQVRDNNPDPVWMPIEVDIRQLCSADEARPLKLQVMPAGAGAGTGGGWGVPERPARGAVREALAPGAARCRGVSYPPSCPRAAGLVTRC